VYKLSLKYSELQQAITFANSQGRIALETPQAHMSWMGDSLLYFDKIIDPKEARKILASVTLGELQSFANSTFLYKNLAVATIGPQSEEDIRALLTPLESLL